MLTPREQAFLDHQRVARLATADAAGLPHVVPVCFALEGASLYISIDEKPKRSGVELKRLRNIRANPNVALIADRYVEDWADLAWVMLHGQAVILDTVSSTITEHAKAQTLLTIRYPQYRSMDLSGLPVIAIRLSRVSSWGNLDIS